MLCGHIVDQFLNQNRFAHTCSAEQADFSALWIRLQQIDHFDAGFQNFYRRALLLKGGRFPVDAPAGYLGGNRLSRRQWAVPTR